MYLTITLVRYYFKLFRYFSYEYLNIFHLLFFSLKMITIICICDFKFLFSSFLNGYSPISYLVLPLFFLRYHFNETLMLFITYYNKAFFEFKAY